MTTTNNNLPVFNKGKKIAYSALENNSNNNDQDGGFIGYNTEDNGEGNIKIARVASAVSLKAVQLSELFPTIITPAA